MQQSRREPRRQALVEAAYRELAERGFEGLRTREVAAAVGVNIATLHYYFPSKEALIAGVVEHAMSRFRTTLGRGQLAEHLRSVRTLLRDEPELGAVMAELALRSGRDPEIREILAGTFGAWHDTMRGLLRKAARDGEVRAELDPDAAAALVMATLTSLMLPVMGSSPIADDVIEALQQYLSSK